MLPAGNDGDRHARAGQQQGRRDHGCPGPELLSVPTLWLVFVVNFTALGLIWSYVARSFPNFSAARRGSGPAFIAARGAAVWMLRGILDSILPLLAGGTLRGPTCCCAATPIRRF